MRGDVAKARRHAAECRLLGERLGNSVYVDEADLAGAWADALEGDASGADRADLFFADTGDVCSSPRLLAWAAQQASEGR
jgi:hypothetical protein